VSDLFGQWFCIIAIKPGWHDTTETARATRAEIELH
jgi:hypothetical protein